MGGEEYEDWMAKDLSTCVLSGDHECAIVQGKVTDIWVKFTRKDIMSENVLFLEGLLKTGQSWDVQIFPIFLVSLATARKHWLRYFSLHRPRPPWGARGSHNINFVL